MALQALPNTKEEHAQDPVWLQICGEAEELVRNEPMMADFLSASILSHSSLESALSHSTYHSCSSKASTHSNSIELRIGCGIKIESRWHS
jgi:F0F1-type ATP synthase delta subunit